MTNSELLQQLKIIKQVKPDIDWTNGNRADLLLKIRESQPEVKAQNILIKKLTSLKADVGFFFDIILPHRLINAFGRPAVISIVGLFILISGMSAIGASKDTVPGNILYPVKIASENVQLYATANVEDKARLEMEFAGRRIGELNKLAAADKLSPGQLEEKLSKVTERLTENINTVNIHLAALDQDGEAKKALEVAKDIDKKVAEYTLALNKISDAPATKAKVKAALSQVEQASDKALEVMVAKHDEVENTISDVEIAEKLNNKIATVATVIEKEDNIEVEEVVAQARDLVRQGDFVAALSKISEGKNIVAGIREKLADSESEKLSEELIVNSEELEDEEKDLDETDESEEDESDVDLIDDEVEVLGVEDDEEKNGE